MMVCGMQAVDKCQRLHALTGGAVDDLHPEWLSRAHVPIMVGGHIGFSVAYLVGLYTIFYVARSYKRLELKVRGHLSHLHMHRAQLRQNMHGASPQSRCSRHA